VADITLHPVTSEHKQSVWNEFARFHYAPEVFNPACECYLVSVQGKWIGFIASRRMRGKWGNDPRPYWIAHKTAIRLNKTHPDYFRLWALVSDEQAKMHVARGHRFCSVAPADHAAYRDQPDSGWTVSNGDRSKQKKGYRSHYYHQGASGQLSLTLSASESLQSSLENKLRQQLPGSAARE
jgi:hypothetical protein